MVLAGIWACMLPPKVADPDHESWAQVESAAAPAVHVWTGEGYYKLRVYGVFQNLGSPFRSPYNEDHSILEYMFGALPIVGM